MSSRHRDLVVATGNWRVRWRAGRLFRRDSLLVADGELAIAAAGGGRRAWTSTADASSALASKLGGRSGGERSVLTGNISYAIRQRYMSIAGVSSHGGQEHARHSMMPQSHAKAGDVFWGKAEDLLFGGRCLCLHSRVDMESSDPRRKLPGGQSSPQSLRGIASIVEPIWCMEKVRRRAIICNMHIPAASWQWRHRSQSGAETMGHYFWKNCSTACAIGEGARRHPSNDAVSSLHSCWYTISSSRHLIHHPALAKSWSSG